MSTPKTPPRSLNRLASNTTTPHLSGVHRYGLAITVILLAVVEVLDITIVSVALRNMEGALSTSPTDITWTITAYGVSAAICMPLTGMLAQKYGRKRLLLLSAAGFGLASLLCGLAQSLFQMVLFRGLQGAFGALLPSLAQATLIEAFPGESRNKAMAFFGIGMMLGPIMGPIVGGYIVSSIGWRWIFLINLPLCALGIILTKIFLTETPRKPTPIDWQGLFYLAWAVGLLQWILDKGNALGWFSSSHLVWATAFDIIGWMLFLLRGFTEERSIVNFSVFKNKNFALACLMMFVFYAVMLGSYSWLPLWLELFLGYPPHTAGLLMAPRGIACLLVMMSTPLLLKKLDARICVMLACILFWMGSWMFSQLPLTADAGSILIPNMIQGAGIGFFFVPLTSMAYRSLSPSLVNDASGVYNFFRNLGGSVGVALFTAVITHQSQVSWHDLTAHISLTHEAFQSWLHAGQWTSTSPQAYGVLNQTLTAQTTQVAFDDANDLFGWLALCILPWVFWIKASQKRR